MRWYVLLAILSFISVGFAAESGTAETWVFQSDSLRLAGQDAAALELLASAQRHFSENGDPCSGAMMAERRSRIHLDWRNPMHADKALTEALNLVRSCPESKAMVAGWQFALAQAKLDQGFRSEARQALLLVASFIENDGANVQTRTLALESLSRLAKMSFAEGAFSESESDHLGWAAGLISQDRRAEAAEVIGWAGVCSALDNPQEIPSYWGSFPDDPSWQSWNIDRRTNKGVEWGRILLGGGALQAFDALANWPWAQSLERNLGTVEPSIEAQWALLVARRWRNRPTQALAASLHAELASREISFAEKRSPILLEALRLRAELLAETGAHGPAYRSLAEADSLSRSMLRADRARTGLFESEPWLAAIGDARTALETTKAAQWREMTFAVTAVFVLLLMWTLKLRSQSGRAHKRLRRLQQQWLPGKQNQINALARSGARIVGLAQLQSLPGELKLELDAFGRLAALCSAETVHQPVNLERICGDLAKHRSLRGILDWSLQEEVPFQGDEAQIQDFFGVLLEGVGSGSCRMEVKSGPEGLNVALDEFSERGWWRQAMSLFAGDGKASNWSLIRLRCDRLGGVMNLDCNAGGANKLSVSLPVYSA